MKRETIEIAIQIDVDDVDRLYGHTIEWVDVLADAVEAATGGTYLGMIVGPSTLGVEEEGI